MAQQEALDTFPRPSVAVDVAVCSIVTRDDGHPGLAVLLIRRTTNTHKGNWSLPGSFVRERERLDAAVRRTLHDKAGVEGLHPRQLVVLDEPKRDNRGWVLSVAHVETVPIDGVGRLADPARTVWAPVVAPQPTDLPDASAASGRVVVHTPDGRNRLPFDHDRIVQLAVDDLRRRYRERPDPDGLLSGPFTVRELREVHEAVLDVPLQKDTFRRLVMPSLELAAEPAPGAVGRPAARYVRAATAGLDR